MLTSLLRRARRWLASPLPRYDQLPMCVPEWSESMAERHAAIWWKVKPYTTTNVERIVALCQSIAYLEKHGVPGAIVECGVGKAGGVMASALALLALESTQRQLYLYDTFLGMTEKRSLADVKQAMMQTRYPWEKLIFVQGELEVALPRNAAEQIGLLRLKTDRYETTYHALKCLYPRLTAGGIFIVDDYGARQGAKQAVDAYLRDQGIAVNLRTIDDAGRWAIKQPLSAALRMAA